MQGDVMSCFSRTILLFRILNIFSEALVVVGDTAAHINERLRFKVRVCNTLKGDLNFKIA